MISVMSKEFKNGMSYEDFYRSSFGMTTDEVKMTITCGIDLNKKKDEVTGYDRHRKARTAGMSFWFDSIDCMQVLADAYGRPVCYHPDSVSKSQLDVALTNFPLVLPKRLDQKPVPLHFQYIGGIHWGAVKLKNSSSNLPPASRVYFNSYPDSLKNYNLYWNKWGQFPKEKAKKKNQKLLQDIISIE
ncbi:hypothetical protein BD560DRAFT_490627 [Blakeslea trispora]|nr:hypothetical protein BD560DRAFT_490627 [Blakeslea trispora]